MEAALQGGVALPLCTIGMGALTLACDAHGWFMLLPSGRLRRGYRAVFNILMASEAITRTLPLGAAIADSVKAALLKKEFLLPASDGFASAIARRWFLGLTQALFLCIGAAAFFGLSNVRLADSGSSVMAWTLALVPLVLLVILFSVLLAPLSRFGTSFLDAAERLPVASVQLFLRERRNDLGATVDALRSLRGRQPRRLAASAASFFLAWWSEVLETYLLLLLLGFSPAFTDVLAIETIISAVKLTMFFLPSGVGVQEFGYAGLLAAFGILANPLQSAQFLLLKRVRDVVWIVIGYVMLFARGIRLIGKSYSLQVSAE